MFKRILIIDDDEDILDILNIIFQDEGYQVVISNTGEAAEHIQLIHPDLVLLDVRLQGSVGTGAEICARIKSQSETSKLPVILISAEADIDDIAKQCGADAYINKPFDITQLLNQIKEFVPLS